MRILGIDPGLRTTGFGVVDTFAAGKLQYVASGTIKTKSVSLGNLPQRIKMIVDGIMAVQERYQADAASVEIVFVNVNPQATLMLGQARGAALAALTQFDLPVSEYTALQVKKAVTGNGRASKNQIQLMVTKLLNLSATPGSDAADALAIAITHAHAFPIARQITAATQLQRKTSALYKKSRYY